MPWTPRARGLTLSALVHAGALLALGVVAVSWKAPAPEPLDPPHVALIDPSAAAAPPLPKGTSTIRRREAARPEVVLPEPEPQPDTLVEPEARPEPVEPETAEPAPGSFGSENGDEKGTDDGIEGGVPGGQPGGVPGGSAEGCVGCTGEGSALDYDQGPRLLQSTRPVYPQEAFVKKIEGVVTVRFLIDATGVVVSTRVIRSVPLLDQAAMASVRQWRFAPAVKKGRAVPALATAPVSFRIF